MNGAFGSTAFLTTDIEDIIAYIAYPLVDYPTVPESPSVVAPPPVCDMPKSDLRPCRNLEGVILKQAGMQVQLAHRINEGSFGVIYIARNLLSHQGGEPYFGSY